MQACLRCLYSVQAPPVVLSDSRQQYIWLLATEDNTKSIQAIALLCLCLVLCSRMAILFMPVALFLM